MVASAEGDDSRPTMMNTTIVTEMLGTVVFIMLRMWSNRGTPAIDDARLVVSLNGEILSPKYAPEMMAPATQPSLMPKVWPMPIRPTPTVAIVVHDEPIQSETSEQMAQAVSRNHRAEMTFRP